MDLPCAEVAKRDLYRRPHVTYISQKVGHSDLVFRGWCGVDKRYLLVKFDGPAMHSSGQTGFVPHTTYISEKVGHSDLVFKGWCGVDKRYLLLKFDGPAMHETGQTGFVPQTACDLYFRGSR
jgi:hypothetical protein